MQENIHLPAEKPEKMLWLYRQKWRYLHVYYWQYRCRPDWPDLVQVRCFHEKNEAFQNCAKDLLIFWPEEEKKLFTGGMKTDCETLDIYIITNIFTILVLFSSSFFNFANFKSILIHFSGKFSRKSQNPTSIFFLQIFIFDRWI